MRGVSAPWQKDDKWKMGAYQIHSKQTVLCMWCFYECERAPRYVGHINLELKSLGSV